MMDDVESAITREEVRKLIHERVIISLPEKGVSSSRAKIIRAQKSQGQTQRPGSITGAAYAKVTKKEAWMNKIRSLETEASRVEGKQNYN